MMVNLGPDQSDPFAEEALPQEAVLRDSVDLHLVPSSAWRRGGSRAEERGSRCGETSVSPEMQRPRRSRHASAAAGSRRTRSKARPAQSQRRQDAKVPMASRARPAASPLRQGHVDSDARHAASLSSQVVEASVGGRNRSVVAPSPRLVGAPDKAQPAPNLSHDPSKIVAEPDPDEHCEQCVVCFDRDVSARMIPCGHALTCFQCAKKLAPQRCPFCRAVIVQIVPIKGHRLPGRSRKKYR